MIGRIRSWVEARTGAESALKRIGDAPMTGGAAWSRTLGFMLVALLLLEVVTGVAMAFYYSPSTTDAWASVHYFETQVTMGALIRGIHHWGMDALIVVAILHLITTFVRGSYKKPREVTWLLGLVSLLVIVGFSVTGFILAYDAKGLAANQVETQIMNSMPLLGPIQRELLIGGNEYGNLSLTRFYSLHALILPALLLALVVWHIRLARKHGPTPGWSMDEKTAAAKTVPWWPNQAFRDALGALVCVGIVVALAAAEGAPLRAPADPSGSFDARPEWYFMPLFQLRKIFTGPSEIIATAVIPGLGLLFLAAVPFVDRKASRHPGRRSLVVGPFALGILGGLMLAVTGVMADKNNEEHQKSMAEADEAAERAKSLAVAGGGVPLDPMRLIENDPIAWGEQLFAEHCTSCHSLGDGAGTSADLAGWGSRPWVERFLDDPNHPHLYGGTELACKMDGVEAYGVEEEDVKALVDGVLWVRGDYAPAGLPGDTVERYVEVFDDGGCAACHHLALGDETLGSLENSVGPDLTTYGSAAWVDELLLFPDSSAHYGALNAMPTFARDLDKAERIALREYTMSLAQLTIAPDPKPEAFEAVACGAPKADAEPTPEPDGEQPAVVASALPSWERGKALFEGKCSNCHIVGGEGSDIGPELTGWGSAAWVKGFMAEPDHARYYGGTDLEGEMPPIEDLGLDDEDDIELLTQAFLIRRNGGSPALEAAIAENAIEIFDDASCGACHLFEIGELSAGSEDGTGPVLTGYASAEWLHGLLEEADSPRYFGDNSSMPSFDDLSEAERDDLTHYMMSLSGLPHP